MYMYTNTHIFMREHCVSRYRSHAAAPRARERERDERENSILVPAVHYSDCTASALNMHARTQNVRAAKCTKTKQWSADYTLEQKQNAVEQLFFVIFSTTRVLVNCDNVVGVNTF